MRNWTRCLMSENGTVNELLEFTWNKNVVLHFHCNIARNFGSISTFEVWKNNTNVSKNRGKFLEQNDQSSKSGKLLKGSTEK